MAKAASVSRQAALPLPVCYPASCAESLLGVDRLVLRLVAEELGDEGEEHLDRQEERVGQLAHVAHHLSQPGEERPEQLLQEGHLVVDHAEGDDAENHAELLRLMELDVPEVLGHELQADGAHEHVGDLGQDGEALDELDEDAGDEPHGQNADEHAGDHDPQLGGERYGRDDVVHGEGHVRQLHCHHRSPEAGGLAVMSVLFALFGDAEVRAHEVDEVAPAHQLEPGVGDEKGDEGQAQPAHDVGAEDAVAQRLGAQVHRQVADHGRQHERIVHAEQALEDDEREDDRDVGDELVHVLVSPRVRVSGCTCFPWMRKQQ